MSRRVAVVDIGSGSTSLAIFEAGPGGFLDRVDQDGEPLRLVQRMDTAGRLEAAAVRQLILTVDRYIARARAAGVGQVEIVATSAMRDARNGPELVAEFASRPGVRARLIDGHEEGRLAAHCVLSTLPFRDGVVLDLGGGSLQLVRVRDGEVVNTASLPLGGLRLYHRFLAGQDTPTADALCALRHFVMAELRAVSWLDEGANSLVALGGSARSIGKIERKRRGWRFGHGHGYRLDGDGVLDVYERLSRIGAARRAETPGLPPQRVDTIVPAALVLSCVLRAGRFAAVHLSTYGIREGVAFQALFGPIPIPDPSAAGLSGRLGAESPAPASWVPGLSPREQRLYAAARGRPVDWLFEKPIQGFWQEEVSRVALALEAEHGAG